MFFFDYTKKLLKMNTQKYFFGEKIITKV